MKKKTVLIAIYVLTLALLVASGSTISWLVAESGELTNTFSPSNINITLDESDGLDFQMIPGSTITKDPKVSVEDGSIGCWLFIKVVETDNLDTYISYTIADGWNPVAGYTGFYYREAKANDSFSILRNDEVTVNEDVTKSQMDALYSAGTVNQAACPKLTFYAAAVQKANIDTYGEAWTALPSEFTGVTNP